MAAAVRSPLNPAPPIETLPQGDMPSQTWLDWFRDLRATLNAFAPPAYTVATLPSTTAANNPPGVNAPFEGQIAFALDGRKVGEGAAAGTGVPVYFSAGAWLVFSTDAAVAA